MKRPANIPCCVCAASDSVLAFEMQYPERNYPGTFVLRRCAGCGLLFNSPRLLPDELRGLYDRNYYVFDADPAKELARVPEVFRRTVALVEERISARNILEIGCAKGYLLAVLSQLGWATSGIEISSDAAAYARNRFRLPVFSGTVEQFTEGGERGRFPLIIAVDVVEHVPDPRVFVKTVRDLLEEGGVFIIDTPNGAARNIEVLGERWGGFNPYHIFLFSAGNLCRLLEGAGFTVEKAFSYGNRRADPAPDPGRMIDRREWLRRVLLCLGLYRPSRHLFRQAKRIADREKALDERLRAEAISVREGGDYFSFPDSSGPLAGECAGDNFVVIARRTGE